MSAIAPRNSSPAIVVERKGSSGGKMSYPSAGGETKDVILELIVLTGAAVTIIIVTYLIFSPLFSGLFGSVTDTINTITDVTSEALGTVTEVLGGIIEGAADAVSTVVDAVNTTIDGLSSALTGTLSSATGAVSGVASTVTGTVGTLTTTISNLVGSVVDGFTALLEHSDEIIEGIIGLTEDIIPAFKAVLETVADEFQNVVQSIRNGIENVVQGVQDGIRFLIDPFVNETYGIPAIANQMLSTVNTLTGGITSVGDNIQTAISSIANAIDSL